MDIAAIEHRNDFLHGRITELPNANGEPKKVSREVSSMEIYYISLRLYMLVSMLILKYIGYDGRIVNQPKIQQHN